MNKPKCKTCNKTLKRVTQDVRNQKEPYKGNLICYMKKKTNSRGLEYATAWHLIW